MDAQRRTLSVTEAARSGDELELLYALRDRLAVAVEDPGCPKRDLASLSLRLTTVVKEIKAAESQKGDDEIGKATETPDAEFDPEAL